MKLATLICLALVQPFRLAIAIVLLPLWGIYRLANCYDEASDANAVKWITINLFVGLCFIVAIISVILSIPVIAHQHGVNGK